MEQATPAWDLEAAMLAERDRLVRLCAYLSGDIDAAEDLAQQTLIEAWQHADTLRDHQRGTQWLSGIARNVCLRWSRRRASEWARLVPLADDQTASNIDRWLVDDWDIEDEVERHELVTLLDRALDLLHPVTRAALTQRYVEELPQAEIAARLGLSEGAVEARLHRGKLQLRRVFATQLHREAATFGFSTTGSHAWQATRIWCPLCGQQQLMVRLPRPPGTVAFRCPACHPAAEEFGWGFPLAHASLRGQIGVETRPTSAFKRMATWAHEYFSSALATRSVRCTNCGRPATLQIASSEDILAGLEDPQFLFVLCDACGAIVNGSFMGLIMNMPMVQRFWREHSRMRMLAPREVEAAGQAAVVTRFESVISTARLDVISLRDTCRVIATHGTRETERG